MRNGNVLLGEPWPRARRLVAAIVALVYGGTNVVFCHAAEASFWTARRTAARKMGKPSAAALPSSNDALILAQLPGGARLDFQGPVESSVIPTAPPTEHLVGGKIPVFESDLPRWLADVVAPYGNMRDVYLSKRPGAPLVIQVQDLHDSSEAQRNIAGLVESLQDERGVSLVGLEGAQGAFATEAFRSFPDAEITKAVATYFMDEGYLGGPEFAGITAKRMPLLWGVEDMKGYDANVAAVKHAAQNRPVVESFLREARRVMTEIKDRRLSVKLLEFDRHLTGYHLGKEPLGAYVRYLLKSSPLSVAHVPNLILLRDALHWEDSLDFKRIEVERTKLLERMVAGLSKASLNQLVAESARYRLGRISYGDYYRFLRTLCTQNGINLDEYSQLSAYVCYVLLAERINRNDLLTELGTLERAVQDSLAVTAEEKNIVVSARNLALLERLVAHAYTPADWAYQVTHQKEIMNVGSSIISLAQQTGILHTLSPPTPEILQPFEDFCRQAVGRNAAMVQNLLEKMRSEKRATAVLVAGGFHTEGLTQLLRLKDISYAVVTPKVNGTLPDGHRTLDLLARDPAPLEKLFAGETVNIPLQRIINPANGGIPLVRYVVSLFLILVTALHVMGSNVPTQFGSPSQQILPQIAYVSGKPSQDGAVRVAVNTPDGKTARYAVSEKSRDSALRSNQVGAQVGGRNLVVTNAPSGNIMERARGWVAKGTSAMKVGWEQALAFVLSLGLWIKLHLKNMRFFGKRNISFGLFSFLLAPAASAATVAAVTTTSLLPLIGVLFLVPFTLLQINNAILRIRVSWALGNLEIDEMEGEILRHITNGLPFDHVGKVMHFAVKYDIQNWRVLSNQLLAEIEGMERLGLFARLAGAVNEKKFKTPFIEIWNAVKGENKSVLDSALEMMLNVEKSKFSGKEADILTAALWAANNNINDINTIPGGFDAFIARLQQGKPEDQPGAWVDKLAGLVEKNKSDLGQVLVANGDMNRISALNDAFKTLGDLKRHEELVGDLLVQPGNMDIPSPFLQMWKTLATLVAQEGGFLYAGQGGDEFRVYLEGKDAQERGHRIVRRYHQILAERYDFYTVSLEEGDKSNFENTLKSKFNDLAKNNGVWLVRHGGEYVVMVDRKYSTGVTKKTIQKTATLDGFKSRVVFRDATRPGLGLFTISLGGVAVSSVVEALEKEKGPDGAILSWKNTESGGFDSDQTIPLALVSDWAGNDALAEVKEMERNRFDVLTDGQDVKGQMRESISYEKIKKLREEVNAKKIVPAANRPGWLYSQEEFRNKVKNQDGDFYFVDVTRYLKPQFANTIVMRTLRRVLGWVEKYPFVGWVIPESLLRQELKRTELRAFHNLKGTDDVLGDQVRDFFRLNILRWIMPNQQDLNENTINGIQLPEGVFATNFGPDNLLIFVKKSEGTGRVQPSLELNNLSNVQDNFKNDLTLNIEKLNDKEVLPHLTFLHVEAKQIRNDETLDQTQENPFQTIGELQDLEGIFLSSSKITGSEGAKRGPLTEKLDKIVDVNPGNNVLLMEFNPLKRDAFELKRAEIEKSKGFIALALLRSRVPPQLVSALWSGMANLFGRNEYVARRWLSGHFFQSFGVPLIEILLLPGLMYFAAPYFGLGLVIPFAALINAFLHGFPVSSRGPPQAWYLQTLGQFTVRLWVSTLIYAIAASAGLSLNVDSLSLLLADQIQTLNTLPTFVTGYVSHAIYNFVVPESYRLAIPPVGKVSKNHPKSGESSNRARIVKTKQRDPEPEIGRDLAFVNGIIANLRSRNVAVSPEDEAVLLYVYRLGSRAFKPSRTLRGGYGSISPGTSFEEILFGLAKTVSTVNAFIEGIYTSAQDDSTKTELLELAINGLNPERGDPGATFFVRLVRLGQQAEAASERGVTNIGSPNYSPFQDSGMGIQAFVQKKKAELAKADPSHYGVSFSNRVKEWGGSLEAQAAALVGGMAYTQNIPINRLSKFIQGQFSGLDDDVIRNIEGMITSWMRTRGIPYLPRIHSLGIIRNQMGLVMNNIGKYKSGDVLRMVFISKMLDLEALPPSKTKAFDNKISKQTSDQTTGFVFELTQEQRRMVEEINELWAPLAERLGANDYATDLKDETLFITQPDLYRTTALELFRLIDHEGYSKTKPQNDPMWNPRGWFKEKQRGIQGSMDFLTNTLWDHLKEKPDFAVEGKYIRMVGRLKSIASINEKKKIDRLNDISKMNDLVGISIILPTNKDNNDFGVNLPDDSHYVRAKQIQEVLRAEMGEPFSEKRPPGGNPPKGKEYDNYKIVLDPRPNRNFYGGVLIEAKIFDEANYGNYKTGLMATWVYNLEKRLGVSRVRIDEAPVSESFDDSVDAFLTSNKFVYVGVLREQSGQTYLDPIRLGKKGSPADAAAHRKVDILKMGEYYAMRSGVIGWGNVSPALGILPETTELQSGMILIPVMENDSSEISGDLTEMRDTKGWSQSILRNADKKRTKLMVYLRENPERSEDFHRIGLGLVQEALKGSRGETTLSPVDILFHIAPIVDTTGLKSPEELFMWMGAVYNEEGYDELRGIVGHINKEFKKKRLKAKVTKEVGQWKVTISGKYNRPGIRSEVAGIMKLMGVFGFHEVIPEISHTDAFSPDVGPGDQFSYGVLIDSTGIGLEKINGVIDQIKRIPDHKPEESPAVVVKLFFEGSREQTEGLDNLLADAPGVSVDISTVSGNEDAKNATTKYLYVLRFPGNMATLVMNRIDDFFRDINLDKSYTYPREVHPVSGGRGGLWFKNPNYRKYAFGVETIGLFILLAFLQDPLVVGLSVDPIMFTLLYPFLFWFPHLLFNRELAFTPEVGELSLNKLAISLLVWGPGASMWAIGLGIFLLAYTTLRHYEMNGGKLSTRFQMSSLLQPVSLVFVGFALALVVGGLLFPLDTTASVVQLGDGTHVFDGITTLITESSWFKASIAWTETLFDSRRALGGVSALAGGIGGGFFLATISRVEAINILKGLASQYRNKREDMRWRENVLFQVGVFHSLMDTEFGLSKLSKDQELSQVQLGKIVEFGKEMVDELFVLLPNSRLSEDDRTFFYEAFSENNVSESERSVFFKFVPVNSFTFNQIVEYFALRTTSNLNAILGEYRDSELKLFLPDQSRVNEDFERLQHETIDRIIYALDAPLIDDFVPNESALTITKTAVGNWQNTRTKEYFLKRLTKAIEIAEIIVVLDSLIANKQIRGKDSLKLIEEENGRIRLLYQEKLRLKSKWPEDIWSLVFLDIIRRELDTNKLIELKKIAILVFRYALRHEVPYSYLKENNVDTLVAEINSEFGPNSVSPKFSRVMYIQALENVLKVSSLHSNRQGGQSAMVGSDSISPASAGTTINKKQRGDLFELLFIAVPLTAVLAYIFFFSGGLLGYENIILYLTKLLDIEIFTVAMSQLGDATEMVFESVTALFSEVSGVSNGLVGAGSVFMGLGVGSSVFSSNQRMKLIRKWLDPKAESGQSIDGDKIQELAKVWGKMFIEINDNAVIPLQAQLRRENDQVIIRKLEERLKIIERVNRFSRWEFDSNNRFSLREKLLEMMRFQEDFRRKRIRDNNGPSDLESVINGVTQMSRGFFSIEKLDKAIRLLMEALGEKLDEEGESNSSVSAVLDQDNANGENKSVDQEFVVGPWFTRLKDSGKTGDINEVRAVAHELMGILSADLIKLKQFRMVVPRALRPRSIFNEGEHKGAILSVVSDLQAWADALWVVWVANDILDEKNDEKREELKKNVLKTTVAARNSHKSDRNENVLAFLRSVLNRIDEAGTQEQLRSAKTNLMKWNISNPLPLNQLNYPDLAALAKNESQADGASVTPKQEGILKNGSLLVGILVLAFLISLFLPGVTFSAVDLGWLTGVGEELSNLLDGGVELASGFFVVGSVLKKTRDGEFALTGAGNELEGAALGKSMLFQPDVFSGVIYPRYKISVDDQISAQKKRVEDAFGAIGSAETEYPDAEKIAALKEKVLARMGRIKENAQAMVADELDLAIGSETDDNEKVKLIKLKSKMIDALGETHLLNKQFIQAEIKKMQDIAPRIWGIVTGNEQTNEFPETFESDGTENGGRLFSLYLQINDVLFVTGKTEVGKGKSAVSFLHKQQLELDQAIEEMKKNPDPKSVEQMLQASQEFHKALMTMISLLNPDIIRGSQTLAKIRFGSALKGLEAMQHEGSRGESRSYLAMLDTSVTSLVDGGRDVASAIRLLTDEYLNNRRIDKNERDKVRWLKEAMLVAIEDRNLKLDHPLAGKDVVVVSKGPLNPFDLLELERWGMRIIAIVMLQGTQAMHGAIAAKSSGYPCVTGLATSENVEDLWNMLKPGDDVAVFPGEGEVVFRPGSATKERVLRLKRKAEVLKKAYFSARGIPNGVVTLLASPDDYKSAQESADQMALGVGLFRTEHIYAAAGTGDIPTLKDEAGELNSEFEDYLKKEVIRHAKLFQGKPFAVRIFDYTPDAKDKTVALFPRSKKRGADFILSAEGRPFAVQEIRAVMKAFLETENIQMFFPMVSTAAEAKALKELVEQVRQEFPPEDQNRLTRMQVGAMAETQESVTNIDALLNHFDFINIGTKDLSLDLFNIKSDDPTASSLLNKINRNVIDSMVRVLKAAQSRDKPVTACGVLAGNEIFIPAAIILANKYKMKLSVPPSEVSQWNFWVGRIAQEETSLLKLQKMIELSEDNSEDMTALSLEIVAEAKAGFFSSDEYKNMYQEMFGPKISNADKLLGQVGRLIPDIKNITSNVDYEVDKNAGATPVLIRKPAFGPVGEDDSPSRLTSGVNVIVSDEKIQAWAREVGENYISYVKAQVHTAILVALARHLFGNTVTDSNFSGFVERIGLTEEAVRAMHTGRASLDDILRLQQARYEALMETHLDIRLAYTADVLFPLPGIGRTLEYEINEITMVREEGQNKDIERLVEYVGTLNTGNNPLDPAGTVFSTEDFEAALSGSAEAREFQPNALARALDLALKSPDVTVETARRSLVADILGKIENQSKINTMTPAVAIKLWKSLALLVGLNGSLSEREQVGPKTNYIHRLRHWFQALDVRLLLNLSYVVSHQDESHPITGAQSAQMGVEEFNKVMAQAGALRDPHQALTEAFSLGEDIVIYLSENMALGNKNSLTPAEITQIEMIRLLDARFADEGDWEAKEWFRKKKRIVFAVVGKESIAETQLNKATILSGLNRAGVGIPHLTRSADTAQLTLEFEKVVSDGNGNIDAKRDLVDAFKLPQFALFAMEIDGVTIDYSQIRDNIVSFILALAGGLMCQVAPSIVEKLKEVRLKATQA